MIDGTLPNEKREAEMCLLQRKLALMDLLSEMVNGDYTRGFQISGLISNKIDALNERLDNDLWEIDDE